MIYLLEHPVLFFVLMFCCIVGLALFAWPEYRPEIQNALRTVQGIIFWRM